MSQTSNDPAAAAHLSTPEEAEYELRAAEGALWTAGRLIIGVTAFAFASLAFAFFYLRSSNSEDLWRINHQTAPTHLGGPICFLVVAGAVLLWFGWTRMKRGSAVDWEVAGWTALGLMLLALALQIYQLTQLPFFPGESGYTSTFVAWAVLNICMLLVCAYWLETLLARHMRLRRAVAEDGGASESGTPVARLFRGNLEGCTHFWYFAAGLSVFFWILFYLV